ncbi:MAG TPA: uroporphyrinogen-III synthase [Pararhizobium sp.]|nr:uroporphyrinogen-III synthase [Pararhizobium sp.]
MLITRPEPEAARTAAKVRALGFEPVVLPVSKANFITQALDEPVRRPWSAVAVTSGNAVRAIASQPEMLARWRHLPLFAVGRNTAEAAAKAGFSAVRAAAGDGESLARLVAKEVAAAALTLTDAAPLLYCAGRPRAGGFENGLRAASLPHRVVECYRMEEIGYSADFLQKTLVSETIDVALFYSRLQASCLFRQLATAGLAEAFHVRNTLCLSESVAAGLPAALRPNAAIADSPSEDRLLEMLAAMRT